MGGDIMKTVLACIDNSAAARPVLEAARAVAPLFGAAVEAAHVAEDDESTARGTAGVHDLPLRILHGDVVEELVSRTRGDDVVVVAVGTRGRPTGPRPPGHVAMELANQADAPVLVVPPDSTIAGQIHRVLIAMEGTPANAKNLKRAIELTADADADIDLVLIHVDDESSIPSFSDQVQHETDAYTHEFLARSVPSARLELRIGDPAEEILHAIESILPDVIVVGWRQGSEPGHNEVAHEILERIHLPVLLVAIS